LLGPKSKRFFISNFCPNFHIALLRHNLSVGDLNFCRKTKILYVSNKILINSTQRDLEVVFLKMDHAKKANMIMPITSILFSIVDEETAKEDIW
jgi:hypothetical protein